MAPHTDPGTIGPGAEPRPGVTPGRPRPRRLVAALLAAALALVLPVALPDDDATSAPRFDVQCDELIDNVEEIADLVDLPTGTVEDIDPYEYENPASHLSDEKEPTKAELAKLTGSYKKFDVGSKDRMLRRWKVYKGKYTWEQWRNTYIPNQANDARGDAFHGNAARRLKLGGSGWMCEDTKLATEEKLGSKRRYDSVSRKHGIAYEVKSGSSALKESQLKADQKLQARMANGRNWRVVYVFSKEPTAAQRELMTKYGVKHVVLRASPKEINPPASSSAAMDAPCAATKPAARVSTLAASSCPRRSTVGPAKDLAQRSGRTPALAREGQRLQTSFGADGRRQGFMPPRPGGIDWTSLELKYVTDDPKAGDYGYAFSADELPEDAVEPGWGGEASLDLSSDALMTWLALDPSQFWVNLNPDTPETIVDQQFGTTDAGRVLLEADLEMKKSLTGLSDPATPLGKKHWDSLERSPDGTICYDWTRFWIEPQPAKVRVDGDQLFILDAPLQVQIEPMDIDWFPPGQEPCTATAPEDMVERNTQRVVDDFEQPLEDYVNAAPEFADLRRVYTARVAAEWIKDRDAKRPGAFHDVIGSGDVSAWPARTDYDPQDVFDELMELLQTVQYRYEYEHGSLEYYVEVMGGIELPDAPRDQTSKEEFERDHPRLERTVRGARYDVTNEPPVVGARDDVTTLDDATSTAWLGGGTVEEAARPDPTDPPEEPDPTDPPETPAPTNPPGKPAPNDQPGGGDSGGGSGRADPGQDLPDPPQADPPQGEQAPHPGELAATGFAQGWLVPAAIVLVLAGITLVGVRRGWFSRP
ncbi:MULTISPECIES: hypothetical protein [unclassified Isoptericola]|uniref:hypothetical protein n=1 Tax=unclassified Isoptericola TaxID=2623355 RepID=UPI003661ACFB